MENNEKVILSFLDDFRECGIIVCGTIAAYEESNYEEDFDYPDKLLLKDIEVAYKLSKLHNIEVPIIDTVYGVLYNNLNPREAVKMLMTRDLKSE